MTKEQKLYRALQDVFIGAQIEGKGGFVKKQSEFDFFINQNAKAFLQEQFKLGSYQ